jgi:enoyl-CoA hydratase/carnithine racemase
LTIFRPEAGNSVDQATAKALGDALRANRNDTTLRAVIVAGEGGKFFCSGGDLKAYRALKTKKQLGTAFGRVRKLLDDFEAFPLPVLAAIDGYALGGGMEMALACDLRFATEGAKLGVPQGRLGLIPGWNGAQRLVELVGRGAALRLLLTGEALTAAQAHAVGLVDELASGTSALDHALAFTERWRKWRRWLSARSRLSCGHPFGHRLRLAPRSRRANSRSYGLPRTIVKPRRLLLRSGDHPLSENKVLNLAMPDMVGIKRWVMRSMAAAIAELTKALTRIPCRGSLWV